MAASSSLDSIRNSIFSHFGSMDVTSLVMEYAEMSPLSSYKGSPPRNKPGRVTYDYVHSTNRLETLTPSYVPNPFLKRAVIAKKSALFDKIGASFTNRAFGIVNPRDYIPYLPAVDDALIAEASQDFKQHFELRIQLFFQQLLLCYKTGHQFIDNCRAEAVTATGNQYYVAAHSSTLPRLIYSAEKGEEFVFAGLTFFYETWNTTVMLPKAANLVDSAIDQHHKKLKQPHALRTYSLNVLNYVSLGRQTPLWGIQQFLYQAGILLEKLITITNSWENVIGKDYLSVVQGYSRGLQNETTFINKLCFCKGQLSESYFLILRNRMHGIISLKGEELQQKQPETLRVTILDVTLELPLVTNLPRIRTLASACLQNQNLTREGRAYLRTGDVAGDLKKLRTFGGISQVKKLKLSAAMHDLFFKCFEHAKQENKEKSPRKMDYILFHFLSQIDLKPIF